MKDNLCLLTGKPGIMMSERLPEELFLCYERSFGQPLSPALKQKYFTSILREYQSSESGLRWYSPAVVGEADFYEALGLTYPWYYRDEAWDKDVICGVLRENNIELFLDYGCGNGAFLSQGKRHGLDGWGVDINRVALNESQARGVEAYHLDEIPKNHPAADVVTILQTIEHVPDPIGFVRQILERFNSKVLIMSAPCHETLLGHMSDPLSWPPHHISMWSEKSFSCLAQAIGFKLTAAVREPLTLERCEGMLRMEGSRKPRGLPYFPEGSGLTSFFNDAVSRDCYWAQFSHSIVAILEKI